MNAAQCVAGVQRLHSSGAGKAHLTSVLRCNFTAMQTDHFRTKAQQSFKLQQTTGITMFESASEKKRSTALVCPESGCLVRYDLAKLAVATRKVPKREGGQSFYSPVLYCESGFQNVIENILTNFFENHMT